MEFNPGDLIKYKIKGAYLAENIYLVLKCNEVRNKLFNYDIVTVYKLRGPGKKLVYSNFWAELFEKM